jgi:type I restriction-modification system DNA methylase subunit
LAKEKLNERLTEDIVREHFKKDKLFSTLDLEEQTSKIPKINKLLKNASKSGSGRGMPEFIITVNDEKKLVIVVECKADVLKHESKNQDSYNDYAVDGVLLYSSFLSKEYDVLSLAVSGTKKENIKVSYFIQRAEAKKQERIFGNKLISIDDILSGLRQDKAKKDEKYEQLLEYSKILNYQLHKLKIKEDKRSLLVSGVLVALDNKNFYRDYAGITSSKILANTLTDTIEEQLNNEDLQGDKIKKLMENYNFIKTHPSLIQPKKTKDLKELKELIDDIDENINGYVRTYKYYDVLGQFYIEFLRYSNADKGLGIVLTPPHITDFFTDIVDIKVTDIVFDNCTGTGGFLVSSMKKMIDKCNGDLKEEESIKKSQLYGVEYQPEMYPLAVSNMFLHGDGKSNIFSGSCFDKDIIRLAQSKKPTVGFLNPPYKSKKDDIEEFEFILNNLHCLEKHGLCVAIIPMSCVLAQSGERLRLKEELLSKHTLKAIFSMPNELFNNSRVGVISCIIVVQAHIPHPKRRETFFGYFKDDGFYKRKTKGRFDYDNRWNEIKEEWLNLYENNREKIGFSVTKKVEAHDEWCAEAYMETDYSTLNQDGFQDVINSYIAFDVTNR